MCVCVHSCEKEETQDVRDSGIIKQKSHRYFNALSLLKSNSESIVLQDNKSQIHEVHYAFCFILMSPYFLLSGNNIPSDVLIDVVIICKYLSIHTQKEILLSGILFLAYIFC